MYECSSIVSKEIRFVDMRHLEEYEANIIGDSLFILTYLQG